MKSTWAAAARWASVPLNEGSDVPRDVKVRTFPETIVQKVPKLKGYSFFTAENRLAIVDQQGSKVQLVIEQRR